MDDVEIVELDPLTEQVTRVAAIDVGKKFAMVCTRLPAETNPARRVQRTVRVEADTRAILELGDHLVCQQVELVVMEATGVYWQSWFMLLEERGLRVWLVNPRDVKNVPGRPKTDKLDAIWLAELAERGMLRPSFVPPKPVQELRELTRLRAVIVAERAGHRQRALDVLQDACLKIDDKDDGVTDMFGVCGRAMMDALIAGERNPAILADLARGVMRRKIPHLEKALTGRFNNHHAAMLQRILAIHDVLQGQIADLENAITALIADIDPTGVPDPDHPERIPLADRLDEIPGIGPDIAAVIIASHLASWAKLTSRTIQSGAKNTHGPTGKGNPWLKAALGQAAVTAGRTDTFLGARHRRLIKRIPTKKALVATSRNILEIAWVLICDPDARYTDLGHTVALNPAA